MMCAVSEECAACRSNCMQPLAGPRCSARARATTRQPTVPVLRDGLSCELLTVERQLVVDELALPLPKTATGFDH